MKENLIIHLFLIILSSDEVSNKPEKREFAYIKNAATEIYDLLRTTRIEGMAHAHQFEEQLQKILQELDLKEKSLIAIQQQDEEKKKVLINCRIYDWRMDNSNT